MSNSDQLYRIRPLVWKKVSDKCYVSKTVLGTITLGLSEYGWDFIYEGSIRLTMTKPTLEAAQLAAKQWHRERLAADLEVVND